MLHITRGQANTLTVTLKEKQTLTSPYFLVCLYNLASRVKKYAICSDSSSYTDRYNTLTLTESTTELPLSGQVKLNEEGEWEYRIYEQSSSTNLSPDAATTLLETGIAKVKSTTSPNTFTERTDEVTYVEYGSGT